MNHSHTFHDPRLQALADSAARIDAQMMDGAFYNDTREPFITVAPALNTLLSTATPLYAAKDFPTLGGGYFARVGKKIRVRAFGKITTGVTPGNGSFNIYFGTGAAANGTLIMTGTPVALTASQTNLSWEIDFTVTCTITGSTGALFCTGKSLFNNAVIASTLQPVLLPASAPAAVGSIDLTVANIISLQYLRSGSTAETMQIVEMEVIALN